MDLLLKYFPDLSSQQLEQFQNLLSILPDLNQKVNVISRKDIAHLEERHILHSLAIAKKFQFSSGARVLDVGTGGGFPGIPLALMFPDASFTLVDSIGKKIRLLGEIVNELEVKNVRLITRRMEELDIKADFVVSRAVSAFPLLHKWTRRLIEAGHNYSMPNGLISLKGGDLGEELMPFKKRVKLYPISGWFEESFFSSKMIVYLKK
jgi:16S rRNA (guanine527-N7)-methyltransferase